MNQNFDPNLPHTYLNSAELARFNALVAKKLQEEPLLKKSGRRGRKNKLFAGIPLRQWAQLTKRHPQWIHYLNNKGQLASWLVKNGFIDKDLIA